MKKLLYVLALMLTVICTFTACNSIPGMAPGKEDTVTIEDGYLVVNGTKTEHKVYAEPVISLIDGYVAVNGVKTGYEVKKAEVVIVTVVDGYLAVNGTKTEHKVYAEPVISLIDGYVAVNGVKTEYEVDKSDVITVEDGYLVVNGVKTEHKVDDGNTSEDKDDVITVEDGYLVVNGIKTQYSVVAFGCNHIWNTVTTAPTCSSGGYDTMTCPLCDKSVKVNETAPLEHTYATEYSIDNDYHWYKCTACPAANDKELHTLDDEGVCIVCEIPFASTPGVVYDVSTDGTYAEVIAYNGTASKVKIAEEYQGLPVKNIYDSAFYNNNTITSVVIPDSVTSIGSDAFAYCSSLSSIVISDSVTSIGNRAFSYCSSLTSVVIPDSVTTIGNDAFYGCESLADVYYKGSEAQWLEIIIGDENYYLHSATIHYNYVPEE